MSTITFKFPESKTSEDPQIQSWQQDWASVENILTNYVQPDSILSLDNALTQVVQFWNQTRMRLSNPVLTVPQTLAEQIPYDHPSHKKLAEFMLALHNSAKWVPEHSSPEERAKEQRFFWDQFCGNLLENDWRPGHNVEEDGDPLHYANICAFVAQLVFPEQEQDRFYYRLARTALNDVAELDPTLPVNVREARVIAAAQYITYQVPIIFDEVIKERKLQAEREKPRSWCSKLLQRKREPRESLDAEFFWEDWQAWKRGFHNAAFDVELGQKYRDVAQRAADMMALQEKIEDDRSARS